MRHFIRSHPSARGTGYTSEACRQIREHEARRGMFEPHWYLVVEDESRYESAVRELTDEARISLAGVLTQLVLSRRSAIDLVRTRLFTDSDSVRLYWDVEVPPFDLIERTSTTRETVVQTVSGNDPLPQYTMHSYQWRINDARYVDGSWRPGVIARDLNAVPLDERSASPELREPVFPPVE